jgi:hypothetical protein
MPDNHSIMRAETSLAVLLSPPLRLLERRHRPLRLGPKAGCQGPTWPGAWAEAGHQTRKRPRNIGARVRRSRVLAPTSAAWRPVPALNRRSGLAVGRTGLFGCWSAPTSNRAVSVDRVWGMRSSRQSAAWPTWGS